MTHREKYFSERFFRKSLLLHHACLSSTGLLQSHVIGWMLLHTWYDRCQADYKLMLTHYVQCAVAPRLSFLDRSITESRYRLDTAPHLV